VTLANLYPQGWEPLTINSVTIQNNPAGAFAFATSPDTSKLLVNDSRGFGINFELAAIGSASADLVIESNDPTSSTITVKLAGEGIRIPSAWVIIGRKSEARE
jgi:hypothetical protein